MNLLKHLVEYQEASKKIPKHQKFSGNELALLKALGEEPQSTKDLSEKIGVGTTTVLRLIKRLNNEYGGIDFQSFGRSAPSLYWRADTFHSIYDEI